MARTPTSRDPHGEDVLLVRSALAGQPVAVERLVERLRCVSSILSERNERLGRPFRPEELDDLVQDALVVTWRKLAEFEGRAALETWVYRISFLELMNALRAKGRRPVAIEDDDLTDGSPPAPDFERFERLYLALDRLGTPAADVVRMKHLEGRTFAEIAARLEMPENTAKSLYYRGLVRLRALLGGEGPG